LFFKFPKSQEKGDLFVVINESSISEINYYIKNIKISPIKEHDQCTSTTREFREINGYYHHLKFYIIYEERLICDIELKNGKKYEKLEKVYYSESPVDSIQNDDILLTWEKNRTRTRNIGMMRTQNVKEECDLKPVEEEFKQEGKRTDFFDRWEKEELEEILNNESYTFHMDHEGEIEIYKNHKKVSSIDIKY